ncbi:translation elongation factor [Clavibacter michiganensis]|uniref:Translation elongation factor n=1 Tax=Clavibacter michiganensis TaxID=28447 RepID=A0A2S5VTG4_9MICO|nr:FBP domain-containing protein [Clavibacter michiganensis]PPF52414.1 translation elongation factor [Clavibacter michiganensis]PPF67361.1 translation elongation factor [Clavibacter michiganensis]
MLPLTESDIRASLVNASQREARDLHLPDGFADLRWDRLDYLGWRDPKAPQRGCVVVPVGDRLVGVLLQQAATAPRSRAQCTWCQDVRLPVPVSFYSARRAGAAGRNGNTIGTLVCTDFECSANVRRPRPIPYLGFDPDAATAQLIDDLGSRVASFAADVATTA